LAGAIESITVREPRTSVLEGSMAGANETTVKADWLTKEGDQGFKWYRRFFVLTRTPRAGVLHCYADRVAWETPGVLPLGSLCLAGTLITCCKALRPGKLAFRVNVPARGGSSKKKMVLAVEHSDAELNAWLVAFSQCGATNLFSAPPTPDSTSASSPPHPHFHPASGRWVPGADAARSPDDTAPGETSRRIADGMDAHAALRVDRGKVVPLAEGSSGYQRLTNAESPSEGSPKSRGLGMATSAHAAEAPASCLGSLCWAARRLLAALGLVLLFLVAAYWILRALPGEQVWITSQRP